MSKLLVIDDEPGIHFSISRVFASQSIQVLSAESAEDGLRLAASESPDVILLDIRLRNHSGLEVFHDLKRVDPRSLVVFITGYGTTDTAIEAMKLGAYDYLVKPLDADQLQQVVNQAVAISRLVHVPTIVEEGDRPEDYPERLVGSGSAMRTICKQIGRMAPARCQCADHGGKWHWKGTGCQSHLSSQSPGGGAVSRDQLRGDSRTTLGKRAVWS